MANRLYSIIFTNTAEADLDTIYNYITTHLHAETAASELMTEFKEKIMRLQEFPRSCPPALLLHKEYRKLVVGNYLVFYRVNENTQTIHITRVLYGSRNYITLLGD